MEYLFKKKNNMKHIKTFNEGWKETSLGLLLFFLHVEKFK
jgi:hypothetical protein